MKEKKTLPHLLIINILHLVLNKIVTLCEDNAIKYIQTLDKQIIINIYEILLKYETALHINEKLKNEIKKIVKEKTKEDERIILNPTLNDLFDLIFLTVS